MAEVQWIKLYIDMFDKRKIKKLRRLPAGNDILLIWVMLLAMAGKCNAGGMIFITENVPFTEEDLADELDFELNTIKLALGAFENMDMIARSKDGFISVLGWEEHQNEDKLAEIRAKDRERKRLKRAQAKALLEESKTVQGQSEDSPYIEEEGEKEKELEFHSFTPADTQTEEGDSSAKQIKAMFGSLGKGVVMLSDEQFDYLAENLSFDELNKYISVVAECELNGKKFKKKTHFQAILDMVEKDRKI